MSINRVILTGNLTRDPELRSTPGGMSVLKLRMAVNDRRKSAQSGEWEDVPNYVDVTMFGTRAESLARYLSKGSKIAVEGQLRWSEWESQGEKRSKLEVVADDVEFMSSRAGASGGGFTPPVDAEPGPEPDDGEEIPF
jgi:single-strand DNA-binding protein